eukprot:8680077-Heterocapsa_arctica.AAC.1
MPPGALSNSQPFYISALRRSAAATASEHASQGGVDADAARAAPRQTAFEILSQWHRTHLADEAALDSWRRLREGDVSPLDCALSGAPPSPPLAPASDPPGAVASRKERA